MAGKYVAPEYGESPFTCPHCETLAPQCSSQASMFINGSYYESDRMMFMSWCTSCERSAVWIRNEGISRKLEQIAEVAGQIAATRGEVPPSSPQVESFTMVYPTRSSAPAANPDLPSDILADYEEAADVVERSPRSAAALLRLCLQKLCVHFGQPGKNINDEIGALVADGTLRPMIQKAMDSVRIAGNESVHPGELNLNDDRELALALFGLVNLVADEAITLPKSVDAIYGKMPKGKRDGVAQRDGTPPSGTPSPTT